MLVPKIFLNIHNFVERSQANGPGTRAVVWVQGCPRRCRGCFNPDTLPFFTKNLMAIDDLESRILAIQEIDGVTFSGGEPFSQAAGLAQLAVRLRSKGVTIVCFTGHTIEQIKKANRSDWNALLDQIDLLIDGEFVQELRTNEPYRGSANQRLHFLSGRITPDTLKNVNQTYELTLSLDGALTATGFPELVELGAEINKLFSSEKSSES